MKAVTVADVLCVLEGLAPRHLAESWDNVGLQIGDVQWPVSRLRVALDPQPAVIEDACRDGVDLLVTHHPLLFSALRRIDLASPLGRSLQLALQHNLAIVAAHTNLDAAAGGVNDCLAAAIGLRARAPLVPASECQEADYKLVIFVPSGSEGALLESLAAAGAGRIGAYHGCSFRSAGMGAFRPGPEAHPAIGTAGQNSEVEEMRVETVVAPGDLAAVLAAARRVHPYEEMAYDLYRRCVPTQPGCGQGRLADLEQPMTLNELGRHIRERLGVPVLRLAGAPELMVRRVALCSGSGGSLLEAFLRSGAEAYLTGDVRYHEARSVEQAGRGVLDVGHFASERVVLEPLARRLEVALEQAGFRLQVECCRLETDPFFLV